MKTCSTCGNSFSDDLSFCLQDGTVLKRRVTSDLSGQPTEILKTDTTRDPDISAEPTIADHPVPAGPADEHSSQKVFQMKALDPSSRMGCVLSIGQVSAALLVVVGIGIGGLLFFNSRKDLARQEMANTTANTGFTKPTMNTANSMSNSMANVLATPLQRSTPRTISAGDVTTKAIEMPEPTYPPAARQRGIQGSVKVQILVSENGRVITAQAISGHPLLKTAAENAALSAQFNPLILNGAPVKFTGSITYNFIP